jgi:selenocysteine-specific elongation factor
MYVIGTAGHVDHGKSTLIKALTGINPDRLAEEQERQMTIDLGFAWHTLPSGEEIGIIDVPGHRDFIDNMLAGVGGIDLVLFVVAADEGIMPQSREHFNIVKLLGIQHGLIVLTKIDLVPDDEWLALVEGDIYELVKDTFLQDAPIVRVSAIKNIGLDKLSSEIDDILPKVNKETSGTTPRLPIDRVFTLKGFGTIVTGTLIGGSFIVGDQVEILPSGIQSRIRGIQTHKKKQEIASPGNRTAINLIGVEVGDITRGDVLCKPHSFSPTNMVDVEVKVLEDYPDKLCHDDAVKVFMGTTQMMARVRTLGKNEIHPGQSGFIQLMIAGQVVAKEGDRLILRRPSPATTIGGGVVIDSLPDKRHKRFAQDVVQRLLVHASGSDQDRVLMAIEDFGVSDLPSLSKELDISESDLTPLLEGLTNDGSILALQEPSTKGKQLYISREDWEQMKKETTDYLEVFHRSNPLKNGADISFFQDKLQVDKRSTQVLLNELISKGVIVADGKLLRLPDFAIILSKEQSKAVEGVLALFRSCGYQTPSVKDTIDIVGEDLFRFLIQSGALILVSSSVVFLPEQIEAMISATNKLLDQSHKITVADFRDHLNTSRKYAVALLEYLDEQKITIREGDFRLKNSGVIHQ